MPGTDQLTAYVAQEHWDSGYEGINLDLVNRLPEDDDVKVWLLKHFGTVNNKSCFEIGCFPGRYLNLFGELGYCVGGIDLTPGVENMLPEWFRKRGILTGEFTRLDVADLNFNRRYNVVFSAGFIEHFSHWKELIRLHTRISSEYVVIVTPNFRGIIQRFIHALFDRENFKRHNVSSMRPRAWARILEQEGFGIHFAGPIGRFGFWVEDQQRSELQERLLRMFRYQAGRILAKLPPNRFMAPYFGVVAKKVSG